MKNKKIVLCQFWTSNVPYSKYTKSINNKYCALNDYIYHIEIDDTKIKDALQGKAFTWYKPILIKEVIELYNPDYIFFLDADAIVCDFDYRIEDFIDSESDIICTEDHGPSRINAGVFIIKNSNWAKEFLQKWWESCDTTVGGPNNQLGFYSNALWHDQTCFGLLYDQDQSNKNHIKIINNNILNGREYKHPIDKNFIFHAFSYGNNTMRNIDLAYYDIFKENKPNNTTMTLSDISKLYNTDKQYEHDYFNLIYDKLFTPIKESTKKFLELGILYGQSLKLWKDYFTNATIIGADIDTKIAQERLKDNLDNRIEFFTLDQSNVLDLENFSKIHDNFDIIMDDGSHRMRDQQITFAKLFRSLNPGGIYIIEDLHTSLEALLPSKEWCGWGDPKKTLTLNMLQYYQDNKIISSDYLSTEDVDYLNKNIESVDIYRSRPDWSITSVIKKKQ